MAKTIQRQPVQAESLQEVVDRIVQVAKPDRVILFGSAARQEMGPNSDLDFLVVKSGAFHRGRLTEEIYMNLFGVDHAVDVVVVTPEDIERYRDSCALVIGAALADLTRAKADARLEGVYLEDLCFDAQQASEKAIKAVLLHFGVTFPPVHDLSRLLSLAEQHGEQVPDQVRQAGRLTRFAVAGRYPSIAEPVSREEYEQAVAIAEAVVRWAEQRLEEESDG